MFTIYMYKHIIITNHIILILKNHLFRGIKNGQIMLIITAVTGIKSKPNCKLHEMPAWSLSSCALCGEKDCFTILIKYF